MKARPRKSTRPAPKPRFAQCPWCGDFRAGNHMAHCPDNPTVQAATREALNDGTGHIRLSVDYKTNGNGGMAYSTLFKRYGSWAAVAAAYDLELPESYKPHTRPNQVSPLDMAIAATWDEMEAEIRRNRELRFSCGAFRM